MRFYKGGDKAKIAIFFLVILVLVSSVYLSSFTAISNNNDIITSYNESPNTVVQGETANFVYDIRNEESTDVDVDLDILVDGNNIKSQSVQNLGSGSTVQKSFTHQFSQDKSGDSIVTVRSSRDDVSSSTTTVRVLKEDEFKIDIIERPTEIYEGERAVIKYEVQNIGEVEGQRDIVFSIDGTQISTESGVKLGAGETSQGSFGFDTKIGDADLFNGSFSFSVDSGDDRINRSIDVLRVPELSINDFSDQYPDNDITGSYGEVQIPVEETAGVRTEGLQVYHRVERITDGTVVFENTITRKQLIGNEERFFNYDVVDLPNSAPGTYEAFVRAESSRSQETTRSVQFEVEDKDSQLVIDSFTEEFPNTVVNVDSDYGIVSIDVSETGGNNTRNFTVDLSITGNNVGNVFQKTIQEELNANEDETFFFNVSQINQVDTYNAVVTLNSENTPQTQRSAVFSVEEGQPAIEVEDIDSIFNDSFAGEQYGTVEINVTETEGYELENIQGELTVENSEGGIEFNNVSTIESINGESAQLSYDLGTFDQSDVYSAELLVDANRIDSTDQATTFQIRDPQSQLNISNFENSFNDTISNQPYGSIDFNVSEVNGFDTSNMIIEFNLSKESGNVVNRETINEDLDGGESNVFSFDIGTLVDPGSYLASLSVGADNANTTSESAQFDILNRSSFNVVSAEFSSPTIDEPGENVTLTTAIQNSGDVEEQQNIELILKGDVIRSQNLTLESEEIQTVEFGNLTTSQLNFSETAEYIIQTEDDSLSNELNVRGEPSQFTITNVAPGNIRVVEGQTGPDTFVTVTNEGDIENVTTISVNVSNSTRETQRSISGNGFSTATFENIVPPTLSPGDYTIDIETPDDNETIPLTVAEDSQENTNSTGQPEEGQDEDMNALLLIVGSAIVGVILTLAVVALVYVVRSEDPMDSLPLSSLPLDSIPVIGSSDGDSTEGENANNGETD